MIMANSVDIIVQLFVTVACILSFASGYRDCDCSCNVTETGATDVCNLVARAIETADRNEGTVLYLKYKYDEEISPFINNHERQPWTPAETETRTNAPPNSEEIELLKKQFENEQRKLEGKIESTEKHCLEMNDNLLGYIEKLRSSAERVEKELLERLSVAENRISEMENESLEEMVREGQRDLEIVAKVSSVQSDILEVKKEVLGMKINLPVRLEDGLLKGTTNPSKTISELVMQVEKEDSDMKERLAAGKTDTSHLLKRQNEIIQDQLKDMDVIRTWRKEVNPMVNVLKEHERLNINKRLDALEMKNFRRNKALKDLQATMENYTEVENRVSLYKEISDVVFDTLQAMDNQVLPTAEEFREKSTHLEEAFRHSISGEFSTVSDVNVERTPPPVPDDDDSPLAPTPYTRDDKPDLCKNSTMDAVTRTRDGSTYFFQGDFYWKYLSNETLAYGYPRKIADDWDGLEGNLDTALLWSNGKTYFLKGERYWRFTNQNMDSDYPKPLHVGFKGIPPGVDAAFLWGGRDKAIFFKGDQYWLYDDSKDPPVSDLYPRLIWNSLPLDGVDAAFVWENGRIYLFKGDYYYRLNDYTMEVDTDPKYPRYTPDYWFRCHLY